MSDRGGGNRVTWRQGDLINRSNGRGPGLANVVTAFSSNLRLQLLECYQCEGNQKAPDALKKILPVAWQHIHPRALCVSQRESARSRDHARRFRSLVTHLK
jgi:hypothetical protein